MSALAELLREWMPAQRWFGSKGREWADVTEEGFLLDRNGPVLSVHRVQVTYTDGGGDTYLVPISWREHQLEELDADAVREEQQHHPPVVRRPGEAHRRVKGRGVHEADADLLHAARHLLRCRLDPHAQSL